MKKKLIKWIFYKIQILNNYLWVKATRDYEGTLYISNHFYYKYAVRVNEILNKIRRMC